MQFYISFDIFSLTNIGDVTSIGSGKQGSKDGIADEAEFNGPRGISQSESDGSLLVCDEKNNKIRKIIFEGIPHVNCDVLVHQILFPGDEIRVKTIIEPPNSHDNTTLKCCMKGPRAIYLDNITNICYFTTSSSVYKFYNSL